MGIRKFDVMDLGKASLIKPEQLGYIDSLEIIKDESYKIQKSFVKIGWYLKHIRDNELYFEGGYANIWECAADQLGYSQSTASRFINICEKFSKDHNSPELDEKYAGFDKSQMIEMLPMDPEQLDRVSADMTVKQIRDIKMENKEPATRAVQETDDNIPGQTSIETDFPEYMPKEEAEDLKEGMMDVYATSHKEDNPATTEKNSNENSRCKPDLRGLTDSPYCKSCGTPLHEYAERCSVCGQLQDWEGYGQDIDPNAEEIIDGDYREIEEPDPEEENIATSQPEEEKAHDESWFVEQYIKIVPDEAAVLFEICRKEQNNSDRAKAIQKHIAPYGYHSTSCLEYGFSFRGFAAGMDFQIGSEEMHLKYGRFVVELMKLLDPEELPVLKNNDQRKEWLTNYKSWGLWYRDENIDVNYYKYDFSDGSRLVVAEYPQRHTYYSSEYKDEHYYHLLEKNKKGYKKPYDEQYRQQTDSETYLVEFLKDLQKNGGIS